MRPDLGGRDDLREIASDGFDVFPGERTVRFERRLGHPVERVWAALTEPGELVRWWGVAEIEPAEGGRFDVR